MGNIKIGINPQLIQVELNKLLRSSVTRIRRCSAVKKVALEKIREDSQEERAYGFKHINKIIEIQLKSYPRYIANIQSFLSTVGPLKQKIASLKPLRGGVINSAKFNHTRNSIEKNIVETEEKFASIKRCASEIYSLVEGQRGLLHESITGNQEADLRHLLDVEREKSRDLIKELNSCMRIVSRVTKRMVVFQLRLLKFLKKSMKQKGGNLLEDTEAMCDRIEEYISTFYAFKSYIQLVGLLVGFLCPVKEVQIVGFAVAGGAFALDWVMDWIAGLPETRRIINSLILKVKKVVDEEGIKREQLTRAILANVGESLNSD